MDRRHLSYDEKMRAIGMLQAGISQRRVANHLGTSQSVVSRCWSRFGDTGSVKERHVGPQRKTSPAQDRFLLLQARRASSITAVQLRKELLRTHGVSICPQTVQNRVNEQGLFQRRPLRVPRLSRGNRTSRLAWAQEHVNWGRNEWSQVLFTDESRFCYHPDSRRIRVWREVGNPARLRKAREITKYGGGSIMFWGGVHVDGKTDLVLVENTLNAVGYRDNIVLPVVVPYLANMGPNSILQQDNARPHVARIVHEVFRENNVTTLQWPANSPDLNPIEKVWDMMKRKMIEEQDGFANAAVLQEAVQNVWQELDQDMVSNLITCMPRRCRAVIDARGGPSGY